MDLGERKRKILQAVVWSYVETAEPVGSGDLAVKHADWGVKSATIRNEMADLADQGYLRQPHTSAGRIPSDRGYRFYVDHLLVEKPVHSTTAANTREELHTERAASLDKILRMTCTLLTQMTRYTSVATPPRPADTSLRQIFAAPAGSEALLVVILLSTSETENRILSGNVARLALEDPKALTESINALNAAFSGVSVDKIGTALGSVLEAPEDMQSATARTLYSAIGECVRYVTRAASTDDRLVVEGTKEIMRQPEFQDVAKLEGVMDALQTNARIYEALSDAFFETEISVVIGAENRVESLQDCSVITAPYFIGMRERGTLGVVGPTRMDYDRTLPAVSFMARNLSEMLTRLY